MEELISAVMITGKHAARRPLAIRSTECFLNQTYELRELVIVNTGPPLAIADERIKEVCVSANGNLLGDLRNIGAKNAGGDWILQWDDDDWHHPERMQTQASLVRKDRACLLTRQVRYSVVEGTAFEFKDERGIHGTILYYNDPCHRYSSMRRGEDTEFLRRFSGVTAVQNPPEMYVRLYHGYNTWSREHVMSPGNGKYVHSLPQSSIQFLSANVLPLYAGLKDTL